MMPNLPTCSIHNPTCGACGAETEHDGDTYYCDVCDLDYGDGAETTATYRDEDALPCGAPCANYWHGPGLIRTGWSYECQPCPLPVTHEEGGHWHPCEPVLL